MDNQGQQVAILIRAKDNLMPAMLLGNYEVGTLKDFVILEGGTNTGKTSVAMHIKVGNKSVVVQTTAAIFGGLHSSLVGADQRFNEGKPTNPDLPFIDALNQVISLNTKEQTINPNDISDGYHTFGELYEHRIANFIVVCRIYRLNVNKYPQLKNLLVWRSKKHSDGELAYGGGWFVLGINTEPGKQITYHLPLSKWDECEFAETLKTAPEWDGHTSADVLERLKKL